ncbi:septin-7-like isoform X2 [Stylophora pistillata]|uniref:septin-7-like isoform X2 n=1 Tax=Stylophora pistillata TaxID=50429 RepID=UPI000C04294C|nr:septin-7-like isoform X2 [Stylophora pistillata]XP_022786670.1 septin-7-like isoform X2 [Stylophora pistillata]
MMASIKKYSFTSKASAKGMEGYVGFANLPNQVFRKSVKKGFEFTVMVVGESGLGKSTLLNSLFLTDIYTPAAYPSVEERLNKTVSIKPSTIEMKEGGVRLRLTVVDTPGFGDAVDNTDCWKPIIEYIDNKFEEYLNAESRVFRSPFPDDRVHCCLYFIAPTGHCLKPLDIEFMKRLHNKVNVVPVIAKADTLTHDECTKFKKQILKEIEENDIGIYRFPDLGGDDDDDVAAVSMKDRIPFAVVGSNTVLEVNGKRVRARVYPWGVAEVENVDHCDFVALRNMLIRTHMQDLKDVTNDTHYENYRCEKLAAMTVGSPTNQPSSNVSLSRSPLEQLEAEKEEREMKLKKMEQEMEQVFEMKVKEKKKKLKDSEAELGKKNEQMWKQLDQQNKELEEKRKQFEKERGQYEEELKSNGLKGLERSDSSTKSLKENHRALFHGALCFPKA